MAPRARHRVTSPPPPRRELRAYRAYRAAVILAVVLAVAVVPLQLTSPTLEAATAVATAQELEAWRVDVHGDGEAPPAGAAPRPAKGQKRAPCIEGLEVELGGYCWLSLEQKPPKCPKQTVAHEGRCLLPLAPQARPPTSVDAGQPG